MLFLSKAKKYNLRQVIFLENLSLFLRDGYFIELVLEMVILSN